MPGSRAVIAQVHSDTLAEELGLFPGDSVVRLNGKTVRDLIEFQYEWAGEEVLLEVEKQSGERVEFALEKDYDETLGVVFTQAVFDRIIQCRNKCLFCFVDQMPRGLRKSLYVKDDDYRLSFLQGSYITLTNLSRQAIGRIKAQRLSPLYVSVHTTVPGLRARMLGNTAAAEILPVLTELSKAGIELHTQIVLCPGLNDGEALEQTYRDLFELEGVRSLAIVPVGLTKFRGNLTPLELYDQQRAAEIIDWAVEKQAEGKERKGTAFLFLSDEFYLLAARPLPSYSFYEDFPQLENGVGMSRLLLDEFAQLELPEAIKPQRELTILTGISGAQVLTPIVAKLNRIRGLKVSLLAVENTFFGPTVTVAGLLTGRCLLSALQDFEKGSIVLIPSVMLRESEGIFLDGQRLEEIEEQLGLKLIAVPVRAAALVEALIR